MKTNTLVVAAIALSGLVLQSCATLDQRLTLKPIPADLPVSATSSLLVGQTVVPPGDYGTPIPLSLTKTLAIPLKTREAELDLYPDLKAAAVEKGGNAVAGLRISLKNVDSSAYGWVSLERQLGFLTALTGGMLYYFVASATGGSGGAAVPAGAEEAKMAFLGTTAAGLALIGGSFLHENLGKVVYTIDLQGQVVKVDTAPRPAAGGGN